VTTCVRSKIRSGVVLTALLSVLVGCASAPDKVTTTEYEAAVGRVATCAKEHDVRLINDGWDPVGHERMLLRYDAPGLPFEQVDGVIERCEATYLAAVAAKYGETNRSYMSPELMKAVRACLANRKIDTTGREEGPEELIQTVPEDRRPDLSDCVQTSVREFYPHLLGVTFP
jgi:hypothetical protein